MEQKFISMEKVAVNQFVKRQVKGSGKTYSESLSFETIAADAEKQMQIFKEYTELLDSKGEQSFKDSIPDLWRMLNE